MQIGQSVCNNGPLGESPFLSHAIDPNLVSMTTLSLFTLGLVTLLCTLYFTTFLFFLPCYFFRSLVIPTELGWNYFLLCTNFVKASWQSELVLISPAPPPPHRYITIIRLYRAVTISLISSLKQMASPTLIEFILINRFHLSAV